MSVEFDAKNLYQYLASNLKMSFELEQILKPWYYEELKHADAFRRILHIVYGLDEQELLNQLQASVANFCPFESLLDDEFKICVLLAYDECSTTIAYRKDSFYERMGPVAFKKWHRLVIADEARHLKNAVKLIQSKFPHRIKEVTKVLEDIISMEAIAPPYHGTFIFDRTEDAVNNQPTFDELKNNCISRVRKLILG